MSNLPQSSNLSETSARLANIIDALEDFVQKKLEKKNNKNIQAFDGESTSLNEVNKKSLGSDGGMLQQPESNETSG